MAELVIHGRHNDHRVVAELLAGHLPQRRLLRRLVVDATAAAGTDGFARAALDTGTQYLIDPGTPLLQDTQDPADTWARLPFASPAAVTRSQLLDPTWQRSTVEAVVEFQLDHGATAVIPPYLHLHDAAGLEATVQERLLTLTAQYLGSEGMDYPMVPILSVDRHPLDLEPNAWAAGLGRLIRVAAAITDEPIGLALSASSKPTTDSLLKTSRIWRRTAEITPFIAWHAGDVGLLAVTLGAAGYETGLCGAERCNVSQQMSARRPKQTPTRGGNWYGAYIHALGISLGLAEVRVMSKVRTLQGDLGCIDPSCCPRGFDSMLGGNRRQHAALSRLDELADLTAITARRWRLHHLEAQAIHAVAAAARIRKYADSHALRVGAHVKEYDAMLQAVRGLRATTRTAVA